MGPKNSSTDVDALVGERVRSRRLQAKMSQATLGEAIGVTFQQVQKYEKGTNRIGSGRLFKIAEVLQCDVTEFYDSVRNNPTIVSTPFSKSQALRRAVIDIAEKLAET